jgi:hypothetical protein
MQSIFFRWTSSAIVVPLLFTLAVGFLMANYFWLAIFTFALWGGWCLGQVLYSEWFNKSSNNVRKLQIKAAGRQTPYRLLKYTEAYRVHFLKVSAICAVIGIITLACIGWAYTEKRQYELRLLEGWLSPANDPIPANACDKAPEGALKILLGNFGAAYTTKFPATVLSIDAKPILTVDRNNKGELAISTDIYDQQDQIVTEIKDNKILISSDVFEHLRMDYNRLTIVIKHKKEKVLDINYMNPKALKIFGIFRTPGSKTLRVPEDGGVTYGDFIMNGTGNCSGDNVGASFGFR